MPDMAALPRWVGARDLGVGETEKYRQVNVTSLNLSSKICLYLTRKPRQTGQELTA